MQTYASAVLSYMIKKFKISADTMLDRIHAMIITNFVVSIVIRFVGFMPYFPNVRISFFLARLRPAIDREKKYIFLFNSWTCCYSFIYVARSVSPNWKWWFWNLKGILIKVITSWGYIKFRFHIEHIFHFFFLKTFFVLYGESQPKVGHRKNAIHLHTM